MYKKLLLLAWLCTSFSYAQGPMTPLPSAVTSGTDWNTSTLTADFAFDFPWEITYGPDDNLWITERVGEKIVRIGTNGGAITTLIDLSSKVVNAKQGGLMGMAIHPALYADITTTTNNYVYAAYTYNDSGLKVRLVRLVYNNAAGTLTEDTSLDTNGTILEGLPGSADHNSGRLIIGPDLKIYYTIGDQGANQFDNACDPILSQVLPTSPTDYANYPGKTLRINLDGTIPTDNPVFNNVQSHVYTYGHRNAQGIIFAQDGTLYNSEHGAKVDDEINIIEEGKNYGWPQIAGYYDNMAYTYCNWSSLGGACNAGSFSDHNCPVGADTATEYESYPTINDVPANFQPPIGTYGSTTNTDPQGGWFSWPSVAPSGIDIHEANNIPGWGRSLLIPTLKKGTIYRAKVTPEGGDIVGDAYEEFHSSNDRYRDVAISPDGLTIYAITDNSGGTSGPSSTSGVSIENGGTIIKIQYVGAAISNPPVANCQDITVMLDPTGNTTITAAQINNGSTGGNAGIDTIVIDRDTFDCSHTGTPQTVWFTITDNDGNESRCSAMVTVQPNANPTAITAPMLDDVVSNCAITIPAPKVISNGCVEITATTTDQVTYTAGQSGTITWAFNDNGTIVNATQNVTVNAIPAPANIIVTPGASTASITWDAIEDVAFDVRYRELGALTWTTVVASTNMITLTGLDLLTNYELEIRSNCGASQSSYTASFFTTTTISYCSPNVPNTSATHYINRVRFGSQTQNIDQSSGFDGGYGDYSSSIADIDVGDTEMIQIDVNREQPWMEVGFAVWIDLNQDGDFTDAGEDVWFQGGTGTAGTVNGNYISANITIPNSALEGQTRMRVAFRNWWHPSDSCDGSFDGNIGEFEDYSINIIGNTLSTEDQNVLTNIRLYPNPVKDVVKIALPSTYQNEQITLMLNDAQGRILSQKTIQNNNGNTVEFSGMTNVRGGIYFLEIKTPSKVLSVKKLIKL
ncbi:PQQ-dependent sugar dehydrogenase [uncultured Kordia sp.]|uniref:PQQ-dependent sugar dehydrogenase n=1 Tax=uncultured Kordia sp. TaxID=507699 RepID=UPI00260303ED|nr:PQQ-dependent sugar dehydrogenase [uncultured Kordia sp.]